ncbi:MAG TPA: GntR family transcriptional regulator [Phototrophicaceae bacterium]|nr:GntR family transcriptional regulator [Phototrophicaceae bacterium]
MLFQVRPISLREQVVEQIRAAIIEGRLKPNDHITEVTLTAQLGVSRTPVREALILLEREGLVVATPNRGCFVRAFTEQDVDEIFSIRTALENFAGELIIRRLDTLDFGHLNSLIETQRYQIEQGDLKQVRRVDMSFHQYLIEKSEHSMLIRSWNELVAQIAAVLQLRALAIPHYDEYEAMRDHCAIIEAYEQRDFPRLAEVNREINTRVAFECKRGIARTS